MPRKLRIAATVFFGALTLVLCVFWVRSYFVGEMVGCDASGSETTFHSNRGIVRIARLSLPSLPGGGWSYSTAKPFRDTFSYAVRDNVFTFGIPYWLLVLVTVALSCTPWLYGRFSRRKSPMAATLVAVVLGLSVW